MTSAARPTFLPAIGGHSLRDTGAGPVTYKSAKEVTAHTKLKYRHGNEEQELTPEEIKQKLISREQEYLTKVKQLELGTVAPLTIDNVDADDSSGSEESSDDEDDTEELMLELQKIKEERMEAQRKKEEEKRNQELQEMQERAILGNPLLAEATSDFKMKRRWDDDVIFRNQSKDKEVKKRFINDMLRSDFHRKFMDKYVK